MNNFIPTPEQKAIANAVLNTRLNVAIDAGAGTGKSTTAAWLIEECISPNLTIRYCAFNKSAEKEFQSKVQRQNCTIKNFNGMGHAAVIKALNAKNIQLDADKYKRLAQEWAQKAPFKLEDKHGQIPPEDQDQEIDDAIKLLTRLVRLFMFNTTFTTSGSGKLCLFLGNDRSTGEMILADHDPNPANLQSIADRYGLGGLRFDENVQLVFGAVAEVLKRGEQMMIENSVISFEDQVYQPVVKQYRVWGSQIVIVDEAQDLSPLERALVDIHIYRQGGGRVIIVGDPKQAIYAFKGADNHGFSNSMKFWGCDKSLTLSLSRRCPKNVAKFVQDRKPGYRSTDDAVDGNILVIKEKQMIDTVEVGDAIISRTRAPMVTIWRALVAMKKPALILGRGNTGPIINIIQLVAKRKTFRFENLIDELGSYAEKKVERMKKSKKSDQDIEDFGDLMSTIFGVIEAVTEAKSVDELIAGINQIFKESDDDKDAKNRILIMTGHTSKGLEFKRVFNITPEKFPLCWGGQSPEAYEQEVNLSYVVDTRTKGDLYFVTDDDKIAKRKRDEIAMALNPKLIDLNAPALQLENVQIGKASEIFKILDTPYDGDGVGGWSRPFDENDIALLPKSVESPCTDCPSDIPAQVDPVLQSLKAAGDLLFSDPEEPVTPPTVPPLRDVWGTEACNLFGLTEKDYMSQSYRVKWLEYHINVYAAHESDLTDWQRRKLVIMRERLAGLPVAVELAVIA